MGNNQNGLQGVVAIGASAGGVEAVTHLAAGLSENLAYAVLIVLHLPANAPSVLGRIVDRAGPLPASTAVDGQPLQAGRIYVAPPGRHLMASREHVTLTKGPTENGFRPAINTLFRSVAVAFGSRAVGVLMSGVLDDGVLGMGAIRARGGTTICQDPDDAVFPSMPLSAKAAGVVDHEAAAKDIGALLAGLPARPVPAVFPPDAAMEEENRIAMAHTFAIPFDTETLGPPSGYTCPDCHGSLQRMEAVGSFRCHVGHAWTAQALLAARNDELETALWVAIRSLTEKAKLARALMTDVGSGAASRHFANVAEEAERALLVLQQGLARVERPAAV